MSGFKIIIKANAHGFNKEKLEESIKNSIESQFSSIKVHNIKAKGTQVMGIIDPTNELEKTINNRNSKIHKLENLINTSEKKIGNLEDQVSDLLRIIREREQLNINNDSCNCNDWRSVGNDPETGDKLKRCNICERVGVR